VRKRDCRSLHQVLAKHAFWAMWTGSKRGLDSIERNERIGSILRTTAVNRLTKGIVGDTDYQ
jgi:hypothetical protein